MHEHIIALVIKRSKGPCSCEYGMGSASSSTWDPATGEQTLGHHDRGPCTRRCDRCIAREALDADGIEYERDDRRQWEPWMASMRIDCAAAPLTLGTVVTGSTDLMMCPNGVK